MAIVQPPVEGEGPRPEAPDECTRIRLSESDDEAKAADTGSHAKVLVESGTCRPSGRRNLVRDSPLPNVRAEDDLERQRHTISLPGRYEWRTQESLFGSALSR